MRSKTLRWIILITTVAIMLLVAAQLFWLSKLYNYEQKEFNSKVVNSIQGLYEDLSLTNSPTAQLQKLIEKPDPNTYIFKADSIPPQDTLVDYLVANLEDFSVFADCRVALYKATAHKYLFDVYVPAAATKNVNADNIHVQLYKRNYSYVCLWFPHRHQYIISSMKWWFIAGGFVLVVLVALGFSIFYFYKQKFLNEIQQDFLQNVTHEFQTPLTTLTVGLDTIAKPSFADNHEKFVKYVHLMQSQTTYLKHHIENLMKVLKAEATGLVMHKEQVAPNALINNALMQLHSFAEEKEASIQLRLEEHNTSVAADGDSLFVAILNLISNALKYSPKPVVEIETKVSAGKYFISVKDNGIGIDEKHKKRLFKKFYRVPSGNIHNVKGLGLGLYFVKKVIEGHKGTITVRSTPGNGSEFIIELPVH